MRHIFWKVLREGKVYSAADAATIRRISKADKSGTVINLPAYKKTAGTSSGGFPGTYRFSDLLYGSQTYIRQTG
jgi:hypothetical protein